MPVVSVVAGVLCAGSGLLCEVVEMFLVDDDEGGESLDLSVRRELPKFCFVVTGLVTEEVM